MHANINADTSTPRNSAANPDRTGRELFSMIGRLSASESAFYFAYSLYLMLNLFDNTTFEYIFTIPYETFATVCQVGILSLLFIKMLSFRTSLVRWAIALTLVAVGFLSWRFSAEGSTFWLFVFIVCGSGTDIKKLAVTSALTIGIILPIVIAFAVVGEIENVTVMRDSSTVRYAMGFEHPNTLGMYLLLLCSSISVIRFGRNPILDFILLIAVTLFNLAFSESRSMALLGIIQMLLLIVFYKTKRGSARRAMARLFVFGIVAILTASVVLMVVYEGDGILAWLDSALSGRLYLANTFYEIGGITPLGNDYSSYVGIPWTGGKIVTFLVDNAYCHFLLRSGIIPFCIFLFGYALLLKQLLSQKRWDALLFGIVLMAIYGFAESYALKAENFFLFSMASIVLFPTKEERTVRMAITSNLRIRYATINSFHSSSQYGGSRSAFSSVNLAMPESVSENRCSDHPIMASDNNRDSRKSCV